MGRLQGEVPEEEYTIPFGVADVKREGTDVTVVAIGWMVHKALAAAQQLEKEGISVEVIDPQTLVPLDKEAIFASVRKTGRMVTVDEGNKTGGAGSELVMVVVEDDETFGHLKAPIKRVAAHDVPIPFSPPLEQFVIPDEGRIIAAVKAVME